MDFLNFNGNEAFSVWENVKESVKALSIKTNSKVSLDCSFVTPSILALARFDDDKAEELSVLLNGNNVMLWNLSGKPCPPSTADVLNNQILDCQWETPGQFTQAPSLECLIKYCHSVKSWLDLGSNHIAIIYCANGRSRTGILIACLLKEMKAFERSSLAFDYFCGARVRHESKPTLAPSYQILFNNIDNLVDNGGYTNRKPLRLRFLQMAGLPVDEMPCLEIWETDRLVFSSHLIDQDDNGKLTWNPEYGDGYFNISEDIVGDFSIMCRFGGEFANKRDKTTLIFKYQNNTAFLSNYLVELKSEDVDVNPEYVDSLDAEFFKLHLVFEDSTLFDESALLPERKFSTKQTFEEGIFELSKYHCVEPVSTKSAVLVAKGFSEQYACVALQLANNNIQTASSYLSMIGARSAEIDAAQKRIENVNIAMSPKSPSISEGLCATCNDNDPMKRDQLVPCTSCNKCYHTMCFGDRKIPFGINNQVDRRSREKFLMKNYSQWSCQECVGESSSSRKLLDRAVQIGNDYKTRTSIPNFTKAWTPSPTADTTASQPIFSDQDKTAALVRILASNGMTVESLMAMSVEKQKEALLDATKLFNSKAVSSSATETVDTNSKDLRTPVKALDSGIISGNAPAVTVPVTNVSPGDDTANVKDLENYADYFSMMKIGMSVANVAQRMLVDGCATDLKSGVAFLNEAKLEGKIAVAAAVEEDGPQEKEVEALAADQETCPASEHPVLSKFFKMKKCLVARPGIEQAMKDAGVPLSYLDKDPNDLVPIQLPKAGDLIAVSEHPLYKTFFNQLKYRTPIAAIKNKMELAGLDSSIIDKDPSELIPLEVQKPVSKATKSSIKQALRKKKIHWKPLDASKVGKDSLWADKDEDIELDEDEFNRLFVESCENKKSPINKIKVEKKKVSVIDAKRAQNGSISLARIKMQCERHETHQKIREHIENMVDEPFTSEQLQSLLEFLPTPEEESMLKNFKGDAEYLGPAEKYMIAMSDFPSAMSRIDCMIYKQQFRSRIQECKDTLLKIESACDDVKSSEKLKKVLRYILRVGNKLNDGEELAGFSVESLLKLQTAKAFDKNTTVLEYIIRAIFKSANDQGCLQFPDELPHVSEASKLMMENVLVEAHGLRVGLDNAVKVITDLTRNKNIDKMAAFLYKATIKCDELDGNIEKVREKFSSVLVYFSEESTMASHEFFNTLSKFSQDFIVTRDKVERFLKVESKLKDRMTLLANAEKESNENQRPINSVTTGHVSESRTVHKPLPPIPTSSPSRIR